MVGMTTTIRIMLLFNCLVALSEVAISAESQRAAPLPVEMLVQSSHFVGYPAGSISPDGQWVALAVQKTRKLEIDQRVSPRFWLTPTGAPFEFSGSDIWILNIRTGEARDLTQGKGTSWDPAWSPDAHSLAFGSDLGGTACVWIWEMSSGKLREIKSAAIANTFEALQWMPDSRHLVASVLPEGMNVQALTDLLESGRFDVPDTLAKRNKNAELQTSAVVMGWDSGSTFNTLLSDLAVIDVENGTLKRVMRRVRPVWWKLSPNGDCVAAMSIIREDELPSARGSYQLSISNLRTPRWKILASGINWKWRMPISWSPDGRFLVYVTSANDIFFARAKEGEAHSLTTSASDFSAPSSLVWNADGRSLYAVTGDAFWQITVESGGMRRIAGIPDHRLISAVVERAENQLWTPHGRFAILLARDERTQREGFFKTDLRTGESTELWGEAKCHRSLVHLPETSGKVAYFAEDAKHPEDLWTLDINAPHGEQTTHVNPQFDGYVLGATQLVSWTSDDGQVLRGSLLLPTDFREGTRYPLIVCVYGGQLLSSSLNRWQVGAAPVNLQLLATRGYAVFYPDAPQEKGTPLTDLAKSILPGVQRVIDLGVADAKRIGIIGYSYGGYSVLALLIQSKRFKAAVDVAGITNLMDSYAKSGGGGGATEWVEQGQGAIGGSLWQYRDRFIENSPLFYLDKIETPLLIVHGSSDTIPVLEARLAFGGLRRLGKQVVYVEYEGEEHIPILWAYGNQVDLCNRLITWFEQYLKGEIPPQAPAASQSNAHQ